MYDDTLDSRLDRLHQAYASAEPFRHVVIDGFFQPAVADRLLQEFPRFDAAHARNEFGEIGRKAVRTDMAAIGETYRALYAFLGSPRFLGAMGRLTGIPDLLLDPRLYGGGTHENLDGQELDVHVDFNFDPATRLHRRLNLLVYLNPEWDEAWGGALELHSDPWEPETDRVTTILPTFNRAVLFETTERSWHGFRRIVLPPGRGPLSRRCISIYLYTRTRPAAETAPQHGTFYVPRPLSDRFRTGHTLTADDVAELSALIRGRDRWIRHYQQQELAFSRTIESLKSPRELARIAGRVVARRLRRLRLR